MKEINEINSKQFFRLAQYVTDKHKETKIGSEVYLDMRRIVEMMEDLVSDYYDLINWYEGQDMSVKDLKEMFEEE